MLVRARLLTTNCVCSNTNRLDRTTLSQSSRLFWSIHTSNHRGFERRLQSYDNIIVVNIVCFFFFFFKKKIIFLTKVFVGCGRRWRNSISVDWTKRFQTRGRSRHVVVQSWFESQSDSTVLIIVLWMNVTLDDVVLVAAQRSSIVVVQHDGRRQWSRGASWSSIAARRMWRC